MRSRPEHVKCIAHTSLASDLVEKTWCGRTREGWAFQNVDHALYNAKYEGRLLACPDCVEAICGTWRESE